MRTVSFVDCFELEFEGSVFSKAMIAADVDNDNVSIAVSVFVLHHATCDTEYQKALYRLLHADYVAENFRYYIKALKLGN